MCGICGFAGSNNNLTNNLLSSMNQQIYRRGPDEDGIFFEDGHVGLAMRRLSIIDLHSGKQPIFNENGQICVVFNGEIYNYKDIRARLIKLGHIFKTNSDTEVLVHLYEEYGLDFVKHLRGMFAIAIWDKNINRLLLSRDRLGIKPLYYAIVDNGILFGSELKSLLEFTQLDTSLDWQAIDAFFTYTYIPAPLSIYQNVKKLLPGNILVYENNKTEIIEYWDIDFSASYKNKSGKWINKHIQNVIEESVSLHLVSDVPIGAFLSGGIDSSLVVSMMAKNIPGPISTYTMGFSGDEMPLIDERPYAKLLANEHNITFNDYTVSPDFSEIADEIVSAFDEPFADDSVIPSYYICKLTSQSVKVALSGLGGDELFGGYYRYYGLYISKFYSKIPLFIRKYIINNLVSAVREPGSGKDFVNHIKRFSKSSLEEPAERYYGFVSSMDEVQRRKLFSRQAELNINFDATREIITKNFNKCESNDILDKAMYADLKTYLPDDILTLSDRLSMWHSLELRVPLIDHVLTEAAAKLDSKWKIRIGKMKYLLKKISNNWIPQAIIKHKKQGFESPMGYWLRNDLREFTENTLNKDFIEKHNIFDYSYIRKILDDHYTLKNKNSKIIFSLLMFNLWLKKYIR